ncbi:transposase, partial [Ferrovum sp.]|uniref:IS66 family transposase n=1 Tax=Ferrovum sp. TaxID=2609467 RepID=UPI0026329104
MRGIRIAEPTGAEQALKMIGRIYAVEDVIRTAALGGEAKRDYRLAHTKLVVDASFSWVDEMFRKQNSCPAVPLTKALYYAREREATLRVFLNDLEVPPDTNHLERALRVIPMG